MDNSNKQEYQGRPVNPTNHVKRGIRQGLSPKLTTNMTIINFSLLIVVLLLLSSGFVSAADPGHGAAAVSPGTFEIGNYLFPNNLTVGGNNLFVNNGTGFVGIGTTSPGYKLQVNDATANGRGIYVSQTSGSGSTMGVVSFASGASTANYAGYFDASGATSNWALYAPNGNNYFGGNVGIGTTSPLTNLHVGLGSFTNNNQSVAGQLISGDATGNPAFGGYYLNLSSSSGNVYGFFRAARTSATTFLGIELGTTSRDGLRFLTNGTGDGSEKMRIDSSGNVGIGTASPGAHLSVSGSSIDTGSTGIDLINTNGNTFRIAAGIPGISNAHFTIGLVGSPLFTLQSTGNLGIGTTNPSNKLDVRGTGNFSGTVYINNNTDLSSFVAGGTYNASYLDTSINSQNKTGGINFATTSGNVGIGTTNPAGTLSVNSSNALGSLRIYNTTGSEHLFVNGTNGNIGIGTTAPNAQLQVSNYPSSIAFEGINIQSAYSPDSAQKSLTWRDGTNIVGQIDTRYDGTSVDMVFGHLYNSGYKTSDIMTVKGTGNVGIGTTSPSAMLDINESDESATLTAFTQAVSNAGLLITNGYTSGAYTPGVFWRTDDSNPTKPKAGVWLFEDGSGSDLYFGTSNNYATGITNNGLVLDQTGNVGIGITSPTTNLQIGSGTSPTSNALGVMLARGVTTNFFQATDNTKEWIGGVDNTQAYGKEGMLSAHDLAIITGNSAKIYIQHSSGNVGIGTTTPSRTLDVRGTGNFSGTVYINNNTDLSSFVAGGTYNASYLDTSINSQNKTGGINFATTSGNVGIGTTNPLGKLQVGIGNSSASRNALILAADAPRQYFLTTGSHANFKIAAQDTVSGGLTIAYGTANADPTASIYTDALTVLNTGNVGIGTTNPGAYQKLTIGDTAGGSTGGIQQLTSKAVFSIIPDPTTDGAGTTIAYSWANGGQGPLHFATAAGTKVTFDASGNVGIGTTNPAAQLEVNSSAPGIFVSPSGYPNQYRTQLGTQSGAQGILVLGNNAANEIRFGTTGAGGYGNIYVNNLADYTSAASGTLAATFASNGQVYFPGGNVGIGTTSPSQKLDVRGTGNFSGTVYINNNTDLSSFVAGGTYNASYLDTSINSQNKTGGINFATTSGNVGIGTTNPQGTLDVTVGNAKKIYKRVDMTQADYNYSYFKFFPLPPSDSGGTTTISGKLTGYRSNDLTVSFDIDLRVSRGYHGAMYAGYTINKGASNAYLDLRNMSIGGQDWLVLRFYNPPTTDDMIFDGTFYSNELTINSSFLTAIEASVDNSTDISSLIAYDNIGINPQGGSVGIGIKNPASSRFEVHANSAAAQSARFTDDVYSTFIIDHPSTSRVRFNTGTAGQGYQFDMQSIVGALTIAGTTGRIGLGTTSPSGNLEINASSGNANVYISSQGGNYKRIVFNDSLATPTQANWELAQSEVANAFGIYPSTTLGGGTFNSANGTTFLPNGNVGIGTTTPTQGKLVVNGNIVINSGSKLGFGNDPANYFIADITNGLQYSPYSVGNFNFSSGNGNWAFVNGNVGIGTVSPDKKLTVNGDSNLSGNVTIRGTGTYSFNNPNSAELQVGYGIASSGTAGNISRLAIQPYGHTGGPFKFSARDTTSVAYLDIDYGTTQGITLDSSGNLGVGTRLPSVKLDVRGTGNFSGTVYINNNTDLSSFVAGGTYNASYVTYTGATNNVNLGARDLTTTGKIGVGGNTTQSTLYINGSSESNMFTSGTTNVKHYKDVASFGGTVAPFNAITGELVIGMPYNWSNSMLNIKITGYDYSSRGVWEVVIGGYNYDASHVWINTNVEISGRPPFNSVRLASNGTKNVIVLGTSTTSWSYPQVAVTDVVVGYSGHDGWGTGWSIYNTTVESSLVDITPLTINKYTDINGNFGIGTTAPAAKLDVNGTALISGGTAATGTSQLYIDSKHGTTNNAALKINYYGDNNILGEVAALTHRNSVWSGLYVNGTGSSLTNAIFVEGNKPVIFNAGNVGIGTTNPTLGKLHISDGTVTTLYATTAGASGIAGEFHNTDGGGNRYVQLAGNTYSGIFMNGNVGIGTTTPSRTLDVRGTGNFSGTVYINNNTDLSSFVAGGTYNATYDAFWLSNSSLWAAANNKYNASYLDTSVNTQTKTGGLILASSSGSVGIGETAPQQKLHVAGNIQVGAYSNAGGLVIQQGVYPFSGFFNYTDDGTGYGPAFLHRNSGTGNITPVFWMQTNGDNINAVVSGTMSLGTTNITTLGGYPTVNTRTHISGLTNGNSYFNTGGNVGIGTITPANKLEVAGTFNATSSTGQLQVNSLGDVIIGI